MESWSCSVKRWACVALLVVGASAAFERSLDDAPALVQHVAAAHPATRCRPKHSEAPSRAHELQDAVQLKMALEATTAAVKMAASKHLPHKNKTTKAQRRWGLKRSAEEKEREGVTKASVRDQVRTLLDHIDAIPSAAKGVLVGWAVPQIMELRRSMEPPAQDLFDRVVDLKMMDITAENAEGKVSQLADVLEHLGPIWKRVGRAVKELESARDAKARAAAVLRIVADLGNGVQVPGDLAGALGAYTRLLADLAKFFEAHDSDPKYIIPRFAQLANELHLPNTSTLKSVGIAFNHLADFTCQLSGMRERLAICAEPNHPSLPNVNVPSAGALALTARGQNVMHKDELALLAGRPLAAAYDSEVVGEAVGALLQALGSQNLGGSVTLMQRGSHVNSPFDPCDEAAPMPSQAARATERVLELVRDVQTPGQMPNAAERLAELAHGAQGGGRRAQSAESERREPATRAALQKQLTAFLGQDPEMPAVARGALAAYVVAQVMQLRRGSSQAVQEIIDNLVAFNLLQNAAVLGDLADLVDHPGKITNSSHMARLLQRVADVAQMAGVKTSVSEFIQGLAAVVESGSEDSVRSMLGRVSQLLAALDMNDGRARNVTKIADDLVALYGRRDAIRSKASDLMDGLRRRDSAVVLPQAMDLMRQLNLPRSPIRNQATSTVDEMADQMAQAVEDMALFVCSLRTMPRHVPRCAAISSSLVAAAVSEDEDEAHSISTQPGLDTPEPNEEEVGSAMGTLFNAMVETRGGEE